MLSGIQRKIEIRYFDKLGEVPEKIPGFRPVPAILRTFKHSATDGMRDYWMNGPGKGQEIPIAVKDCLDASDRYDHHPPATASTSSPSIQPDLPKGQTAQTLPSPQLHSNPQSGPDPQSTANTQTKSDPQFTFTCQPPPPEPLTSTPHSETASQTTLPPPNAAVNSAASRSSGSSSKDNVDEPNNGGKKVGSGSGSLHTVDC